METNPKNNRHKKKHKSKLDSSFNKLGMKLAKKEVFHDYKSFASMGLVRFQQESGAKSVNDEHKQSARKLQVRLDMALKPEKMESNAMKIKTDLEQHMHDDP